jgi:hypothetical protein
MEDVKGYCMKCKKMMTMDNGKKSKMKNGREMMKGECHKCGCKMAKIM